MNKNVTKYLSNIGKKGGKAGRGPAKARTKEQATKAAKARWAKAAKKSNSDPDWEMEPK